MRDEVHQIITKAERTIGYELSEEERSFLRQNLTESVGRRIYKFIRGAKEHKSKITRIPVEILIVHIQDEIDDLQHYLDALVEHIETEGERNA